MAMVRETRVPSCFRALLASLRHEFHSIVMVALVATIHDFFGGAEASGGQKKTWMVATSATMTSGWSGLSERVPASLRFHASGLIKSL
jgi:hypothetical protein